MPDKFSKEIRRKNMQAIKSKKTSLENEIFTVLWRENYRFQRNVNTLFGRPDLAIKKYRIVIFIDSCFWHGCCLHFQAPVTNAGYWDSKIKRNIERDTEVTTYYKNEGWNILRIWEHEVKNDFSKAIKKIEDFIEYAKQNEMQ
jgi:DNA mismatch endonuclease, patch repair protein